MMENGNEAPPISDSSGDVEVNCWFSLVLQCTASFTAAHLELQQFNQLCAQVWCRHFVGSSLAFCPAFFSLPVLAFLYFCEFAWWTLVLRLWPTTEPLLLHCSWQIAATQDLNIAITPQILRPGMTSHSHLIAITQLHLQPFRQQICSLSSKSLVRYYMWLFHGARYLIFITIDTADQHPKVPSTYMAFFIIEECQHLRPPMLEGANPFQAHGLSGLGISIPLGRKLTH
ncbi:hypothetical protein LguiB_021137 [Lonicera macranthoides]